MPRRLGPVRYGTAGRLHPSRQARSVERGASSAECVSTRQRPGARTRQGSGHPGVCSTSKTTRLLDEPRPGGPRSISDEQIEQVLVATLERTPKDATHWSRASMAAEAALSRSTVGRIWRAFGLKPHLA